jgi:hypothetical protein
VRREQRIDARTQFRLPGARVIEKRDTFQRRFGQRFVEQSFFGHVDAR